ncbi:MAG: class I SAM-dependent methyltransferase [Bacterioplanes sp.]|nr:class I SAM-dependent methyltransferase [Bacterioplanes sp.]
MSVADYAHIFTHRGHSYHLAMQRWPDARRQELMAVLAPLLPLIQRLDGMRLIDVPAGGGYLAPYLPSTVEYTAYDPSPGFDDSPSSVMAAGLHALPFQSAQFDAVVSLAGLHHCADKTAFFEECHRLTNPQGIMVLMDVAEASAEASFLDDFIGHHNGMGHSGDYFSPLLPNLLQRAGWQVVSDQQVVCDWRFASVDDLAGFCRQLFDIQSASNEQIVNAVSEYLGDSQPDNQSTFAAVMPWSLQRVVCRKLP